MFLELKVFEQRRERAFVDGFTCWNDGYRRCEKHETSASHFEASQAVRRKHSEASVNELLDKQIKAEKIDNHDMLVFVIEALKFLGRQGLPLRGTAHVITAANNVSEPNSNFWQTLVSFAKFNDSLKRLLSKCKAYTAPEIQNELLSIMSNTVLRQLVNTVRDAGWYSLMVDETADIRGTEQGVICLR